MSQRSFLWVIHCFVLAGALSARCCAGELFVYPQEIVLSPDYPARFVVLERVGSDALVDRTRDDRMTCSVVDDSWIEPIEGGELHLSSRVPEQGGQTKLRINFNNQVVEVPVHIADGKSRSPIFAREISAILGKTGCNLGTCHGNLHGKGGFRLSLRGDDPRLDYASIVLGNGSRRIDRFAPEMSLLVRKPAGQVAHQGGLRFDPDSVESKLLQRWIEEGCKWNAQSQTDCPENAKPFGSDETLRSLTVYPSRAVLAKTSRQQQLVVVGEFADGTRRDVTRWARFEPSVVTGVTIGAQGLVQADHPTDVSISISYLSGRTASRLTFLAHEDAEWSEPPAATQLDQLVEDHLKRLQLTPTSLSDDYTFIRRAYVSIVGRVPTADEVRAFVADSDSDKYARLTENLLYDPGYALLWSLRWSDLLRNEQKVMSEKGADGWHRWMTDQIASDRPLDQFVHDMLTTIGSTYDHPAASFHRTHRDPETAAESIGQVFLGVRLQCARCHNHPFDNWKQDDYYGLAAYFTTIERKQVENSPKDKFDKHIISGDEVISLTDNKAEIFHPGRAEKIGPKPLTELVSFSESEETPEEGESKTESKPSPLDSLARWLTENNRMFARNMANRIWYHLMGVGIVDPPDDFRDSNPPSNPELLEYLTDEFIRSGYSTRHVSRLIVSSQAFRRSAVSEPTARDPLGGARVFTGYPLRRMPAEVLLDALADVTGVPNKFDDRQTEVIHSDRAVARPDVPTKAGFLTTFGKPGRLLVCECERSSESSLGQSLILVNGLETREKLADSKNQLNRWLASDMSLPELIETVYLTALSRLPTEDESKRMSEYITTSSDKRSSLEDVLWALLNSKEFTLIR